MKPIPPISEHRVFGLSRGNEYSSRDSFRYSHPSFTRGELLVGTRARGQRDSRLIDLVNRRPMLLLASRRHFPFETPAADATDVASTASLTG